MEKDSVPYPTSSCRINPNRLLHESLHYPTTHPTNHPPTHRTGAFPPLQNQKNNNKKVPPRERTLYTRFRHKIGINCNTFLGLQSPFGDNWGQITWNLSGLSPKQTGMELVLNKGLRKNERENTTVPPRTAYQVLVYIIGVVQNLSSKIPRQRERLLSGRLHSISTRNDFALRIKSSTGYIDNQARGRERAYQDPKLCL